MKTPEKPTPKSSDGAEKSASFEPSSKNKSVKSRTGAGATAAGKPQYRAQKPYAPKKDPVKPDSFKLELLQEKLRYQFGDQRILLQSLTHTSYGHEYLQHIPFSLRDNERLEFLGDAIIDVVLSDILLESFPQAHEGQLSKMRAAVVNERTLAALGENIGLHDVLRLGKGESQTGGHLKPSILSSAFEALIAAIYLDGGFYAVYPVVRHLFAPFFTEDRNLISFYDHKTQLQELVQARWKVTPSYHLKGSTGPDHAKCFEVEVKMQDRSLAVATGSSKKEAEQNAAKAAIDTIANS